MLVKIVRIGNQNVTLLSETKKKQFGVEVVIPKYYFARMIIAEEERTALLDKEFTLKSFDLVESTNPETGATYEMLENIVEA